MKSSAWVFQSLIASTMVSVAIGLSAPAAASDRGPTLPYMDYGACPFECCTYGQWTAHEPVAVHTAMDAKSPLIRTLRTGERVRARSGVVVTRSAGRLVVLRDFIVLTDTLLRLLFAVRMWYTGEHEAARRSHAFA